MNTMHDQIFGSQARTDTLVAIARLDRTYPTEIARIIGRRPRASGKAPV